MARHLARNHSIVWEQKQENKIDEHVSAVSMKIDQTQAEKITKKLSLALAQSSASYRLVDNPSFREAIELLNKTRNGKCEFYRGKIFEPALKILISYLESRCQKREIGHSKIACLLESDTSLENLM